MYPASRESAAFGGKAMMGYARPVPNKWTDLEGRFFPGFTERRCAVSSSIARLQTLTGDRQPTVLAATEDKTFLVA